MAFVRESRDRAARPVDWPGQTALIGGLVLLVFALLRGNQEGWGTPATVAGLAGAAVLLVAFVAIERHTRHPMLPLGLFGMPSFLGAQIAVLGIAGSFFAVFLYTSLYLQQILGLSAIQAGLAYLPTTVVVFVVSGATGRLGQRVSSQAMIVSGLALVAAGLALMTFAQSDSSWTALQPGLLIAGVGTGLFNPSVIAVALGAVRPEQSGLASGVNNTFRQGGVAIGVAGLGALMPVGSALGGSPDAYVDGLHHAQLAGAGLAALAAVTSAALLLRRGRRFEPSPAAV